MLITFHGYRRTTASLSCVKKKSRQALALHRHAGANPHTDNCNTPAKGLNHRFDTHSLPHLPRYGYGSITLPGAIPLRVPGVFRTPVMVVSYASDRRLTVVRYATADTLPRLPVSPT